MISMSDIAAIRQQGEEDVTRCGKFEGQAIYVPYLWEQSLDSGEHPDAHGVVSIEVLPEDKLIFPELRRRKRIRLIETDQGFVEEV